MHIMPCGPRCSEHVLDCRLTCKGIKKHLKYCNILCPDLMTFYVIKSEEGCKSVRDI